MGILNLKPLTFNDLVEGEEYFVAKTNDLSRNKIVLYFVKDFIFLKKVDEHRISIFTDTDGEITEYASNLGLRIPNRTNLSVFKAVAKDETWPLYYEDEGGCTHMIRK